VLVVDDNAVNLELQTYVLADAGWQVRGCTGVDDALVLLSQWRPDVILTDIQMPRRDGFDLVRAVRADPSLAATPVVALTAFAMKGDEQRMHEAGCDGYIAKPIDVDTFADTVKGWARTGPG